MHNQGGYTHENQALQHRTDHRILKEDEAGLTVKELCRKYGISDATIYNWKTKYGNLSISKTQRLKELKDENRLLKKLVSDQALDIQMLKKINAKKW